MIILLPPPGALRVHGLKMALKGTFEIVMAKTMLLLQYTWSQKPEQLNIYTMLLNLLQLSWRHGEHDLEGWQICWGLGICLMWHTQTGSTSHVRWRLRTWHGLWKLCTECREHGEKDAVLSNPHDYIRGSEVTQTASRGAVRWAHDCQDQILFANIHFYVHPSSLASDSSAHSIYAVCTVRTWGGWPSGIHRIACALGPAHFQGLHHSIQWLYRQMPIHQSQAEARCTLGACMQSLMITFAPLSWFVLFIRKADQQKAHGKTWWYRMHTTQAIAQHECYCMVCTRNSIPELPEWQAGLRLFVHWTNAVRLQSCMQNCCWSACTQHQCSPGRW